MIEDDQPPASGQEPAKATDSSSADSSADSKPQEAPKQQPEKEHAKVKTKPASQKSPKSPSSKSRFRLFFSGLNQLLTSFRNLTFNLIFAVIVILVAQATLFSSVESIPLSRTGALLINPQGQLVDQLSYQSTLGLQAVEQIDETLTFDLIKAIQKAAKDNYIKSLVIDTDNMRGSNISKIKEIGDAINQFKKTKKPVIAVGSGFTQSQYLLASYADEIWMHPMGAVELTGLGLFSNYMNEGLQKLKINYHVFRAGDYKSANDVFTQDAMPENNKVHNMALIKDIWTTYQQILLDNRPISIDQLLEYTNHPDKAVKRNSGNMAAMALDMKLIDNLVTGDQANGMLKVIDGGEHQAAQSQDNDSFQHIPFMEYLNSPFDTIDSKGPIAVIVASGVIHSGSGRQGGIGSETMIDLLNHVQKQKDIKALIVRIDSGGGSALASEVIRREMELIRDKGIPVLVSMGSVAASGGYWMATSADEIWASPATITGSIGVFSAFPTFEDSLDSVGIHNDGVGSTPLSGAFRLERPLNPVLARLMQSSVDFIYSQFLGLVAGSRDMEVSAVEEIAGGRIWSGNQAYDLGLVDAIGNFDDVVKAAAKLAGITDTRIRFVEPRPSFWEQLISEFARSVQQKVFSISPELSTLKHYAELLQQSRQLILPEDPNNMYLLCDYCAISE